MKIIPVILVLLNALFLLPSCASLLEQVVQAPKIEKQSLNVQSFDLQKVNLNLALDIHNPNAIDLPVDGLKADIDVSQKRFLSKSWEGLPSLLGGKTTAVNLPFTVEWKDLMAVGVNMWGANQLPYQLKGAVRVKGFEIPFMKDGTLDVKAVTR